MAPVQALCFASDFQRLIVRSLVAELGPKSIRGFGGWLKVSEIHVALWLHLAPDPFQLLQRQSNPFWASLQHVAILVGRSRRVALVSGATDPVDYTAGSPNNHCAHRPTSSSVTAGTSTARSCTSSRSA
jgi:hypothetical protein